MILFVSSLKGSLVRYEKIPASRLWRRSSLQPTVTDEYILLVADLKAGKIQGFSVDSETGEIIFVRDLLSIEHKLEEYLGIKNKLLQ